MMKHANLNELSSLSNRALEDITGTIGKNTKTGLAYGISTRHCRTGAKLARAKPKNGRKTICSECYCDKRGNYRFRNVENSQEKRRDAMLGDPRWRDAMINLIHRKMRKLALRRFRIYDSGDFQSEQNILDWFAIAEALPDVAFWAPTQELAMVRRVLEKHALPDNMIIRASSVYIDGPRKAFDWTSGVTTDKSKVTCPAYTQGGACLDCNQCWDKSVKDVTYPKH